MRSRARTGKREGRYLFGVGGDDGRGRLPGQSGRCCAARHAAGLGRVFIYRGAGKLFGYAAQGGISGTKASFEFLKLKPAEPWAVVAGLVQFLVGISKCSGLLVRVSGVLLAIEMALAHSIAKFTCRMLPSTASKAGDEAQINIFVGRPRARRGAPGGGSWSLDRAVRSRRVAPAAPGGQDRLAA
jgi:uncharacterized membrane protein YphA (DoxX/SURF4 family)